MKRKSIYKKIKDFVKSRTYDYSRVLILVLEVFLLFIYLALRSTDLRITLSVGIFGVILICILDTLIDIKEEVKKNGITSGKRKKLK